MKGDLLKGVPRETNFISVWPWLAVNQRDADKPIPVRSRAITYIRAQLHASLNIVIQSI